MNKAEKKFLLYAVISVFVLLTVLLGILNAVNFTMAARDADEITQRIAAGNGAFGQMQGQPFQPGRQMRGGGMGPMGPDSPEINDSVRFFTYAIDKDGSAERIAYHISAVSEEEAESWAKSLVNAETGWIHGTYRFRVYTRDGRTFVTVIDQGREMLAAYRILTFSIVGTLLGTLLSFLVLRLVGRRLFAPIEEADRKQKAFLSNAEKEFKLPLTVISADTELLERSGGPTDQTRSIRRQVRKLTELVRGLGSLAIFDEKDMQRTPFSLSDCVQHSLDCSRERFEGRSMTLSCEIQPEISLTGEPEAMQQVVNELIDNALRYARSQASFRLTREKERIRLLAENDTTLPDGSYDQVFDRFTLLNNAQDGRAGLGLAAVKDIVKAHNGRCSAQVSGGIFRVQVDL